MARYVCKLTHASTPEAFHASAKLPDAMRVALPASSTIRNADSTDRHSVAGDVATGYPSALRLIFNARGRGILNLLASARSMLRIHETLCCIQGGQYLFKHGMSSISKAKALEKARDLGQSIDDLVLALGSLTREITSRLSPTSPLGRPREPDTTFTELDPGQIFHEGTKTAHTSFSEHLRPVAFEIMAGERGLARHTFSHA